MAERSNIREKNPEEIRHDLQRTRSEMEGTVGEIKERMSSEHIKAQMMNRVKDRTRRVAHLAGHARERVMEKTRTVMESSGAAGEWTRRGKEMADDLGRRGKEMADDVSRRGKEMADDLSRRGKERLDEWSRRGKELAGDWSRRGRDMSTQAVETVKRNPKTSVSIGTAVAAGIVGLVWGLALRRNGKETHETHIEETPISTYPERSSSTGLGRTVQESVTEIRTEPGEIGPDVLERAERANAMTEVEETRPRGFRQFVKENPLLFSGIVLGVGAVLGSLFPGFWKR